MNTKFYALALMGSLAVTTGCKNKDGAETPANGKIEFKNFSVTPPLIKTTGSILGGLEFYSLISSDDSLKESPGFRFGGSADGSGFLKNTTGEGYIMMVTMKTTIPYHASRSIKR